MGTRVYWITLRVVLNEAKKYIQRNDLRLQDNLSAPAYATVVTALSAILDCLAALPENTPIE